MYLVGEEGIVKQGGFHGGGSGRIGDGSVLPTKELSEELFRTGWSALSGGNGGGRLELSVFSPLVELREPTSM